MYIIIDLSKFYGVLKPEAESCSIKNGFTKD